MSTRPGTLGRPHVEPGVLLRALQDAVARLPDCEEAVDEALDEPEVRVLTLDGIDQDGSGEPRVVGARGQESRGRLQVHLVPGHAEHDLAPGVGRGAHVPL